MKTDLKPCPFCGGEAIFVCSTEGQFADEDEGFVECSKCHIKQPGDDTRSRAVAAWNRRINTKWNAQ